MANIVESLMDKIKVPEKLELSQSDRQLLQKLVMSVEELKKRNYLTEQELSQSEQRLLAQIRTALKDDMKESISSSGSAQPHEVTVDLSELKRFISEETDKERYQVKALIEEKNRAVNSQLQNIRAAIKDEEILDKLPSILNQLSDTEHTLRKQLRTVKIMMGFTIWISIMTLAAMVAQALGYI